MQYLKVDNELMKQYDLEHSGYVMRQLEPSEVNEGMYYAANPQDIRKVVAISNAPFHVRESDLNEPIRTVINMSDSKMWFYVKQI